MCKFIDRTGETHYTNLGDKATIIKYRSAMSCDIQFEDGTIVHNKVYNNIKNGSFRNPNKPSFYNTGFIGVGKYDTSCFNKKACDVWIRMLDRCYNEKEIAYENVTVHPDWHNFQNFAKWFEDNYIEGFHLDKDILCRGCKEYSTENCCFVPREINNLFTLRNKKRGEYPIGVTKKGKKYQSFINKGKGQLFIGTYSTPEEGFKEYKKHKEMWIKEVAYKWKDKVDNRIIEALMNYTVNITD